MDGKGSRQKVLKVEKLSGNRNPGGHQQVENLDFDNVEVGGIGARSVLERIPGVLDSGDVSVCV